MGSRWWRRREGSVFSLVRDEGSGVGSLEGREFVPVVVVLGPECCQTPVKTHSVSGGVQTAFG